MGTSHGVREPKHGWVTINGEQREFPQGRYYLRSYRDGKKVYTPVASLHPRDAANTLALAQMAARAASKVRNPLTYIKNAVEAYTKDLKQRQKFEALEQARVVLDEFVTEVCDKHHITTVKGVTRQAVLDFHTVLRERGLEDRTIANKDARLRSWLRFCKVDTKLLLTKDDKPTYEKSDPTMYTPGELRGIFVEADKSDPCMGVALRMCTMLGLREQELMYAEWSDIDWHHSTFRVQGKPRFDFKVKDKAQRLLPVNAELLARLKSWRETRKKSTLIVGNDEDQPEGHMLRKLKQLAKRAGLNCGKCDGCARKVKPECEQWFLHKFRATFLTRMLRQADARTAQYLAGHEKLETTLLYLSKATGEEMQNHANAIRWTE
jgi:integrase